MDRIARARKAYGFLYAALPADLRPLVAMCRRATPRMWSLLEKKFRNTEQDTVMALWERSPAPGGGRDFDVYKARVDSVFELLKHAKENRRRALLHAAAVETAAAVRYGCPHAEDRRPPEGRGEDRLASRCSSWPSTSAASSASARPKGRKTAPWPRAPCCPAGETGRALR